MNKPSDIEVAINLPMEISYIQAIEKAIDASLSKLGFSRQTTSKTSHEKGNMVARINYKSFFYKNET